MSARTSFILSFPLVALLALSLLLALRRDAPPSAAVTRFPAITAGDASTGP